MFSFISYFFPSYYSLLMFFLLIFLFLISSLFLYYFNSKTFSPWNFFLSLLPSRFSTYLRYCRLSLSVVRFHLFAQFWAIYHGIRRNQKGSLYNVRQKTHFLEKIVSYNKGAKELEKSHARHFIGPLVKEIATVMKNEKNFDLKFLHWSVAVLEKFFEICPAEPKYEEAKKNFRELKLENFQPNLLPYKESERPKPPFTFEEFEILCLRRRSVRQFLPLPVDPLLILKAVRCAALAPACCNRQAYHYSLFTDPTEVRALQQLTAGGKKFTLPAILLVLGDYSAYQSQTELYCPIIDSMQSIMAFQLALETLGLSSVCINWATQRESDEKLRKMIELRKEQIVVMTLGIGIPDPQGMIPRSQKREPEQILTINQKMIIRE